MRYIRLQRHKSIAAGERGSQVVSFALVAPILISVAFMLMQIVGLVICRVSIEAAAKSSSHLAALKGANPLDVEQIANRYWIPSGLRDCGHDAAIKRLKSLEVSFVEVRIEQCLEIPILTGQVKLVSKARELDEGKL